MTPRVFPDLPDHALGEAQRAARELLQHGLITPRDPAMFRRARTWAPHLTRAFDAAAGWIVHTTRTAVRLERTMDQLGKAPWWPHDRVTPDARQLTVLVLVIAALERADDQLVLSELAVAVASSAARAGVSFDPELFADRRAFCHAVAAVEHLGVVTVRDGVIDAWRDGSGAGEALLDVDREVLRLLFLPGRPLHTVDDAATLLVSAEERVSREANHQRRRQRLVRRMLSSPVVYADDLDEADRTYLRAEIGRLVDDVERLVGGTVERRAEGVALVFAEVLPGVLTLPASHSESVAALSLASDLHALAATAPRVSLPSAAWPPPLRGQPSLPVPTEQRVAPFVADDQLRTAARAHLARIDASLRADLRTEEAFVAAAVRTLAAFDLVRPVPGGVAVLPAISRFRDVTWRAAQPAPETAPPAAVPQQFGLFPGAR